MKESLTEAIKGLNNEKDTLTRVLSVSSNNSAIKIECRLREVDKQIIKLLSIKDE